MRPVKYYISREPLITGGLPANVVKGRSGTRNWQKLLRKSMRAVQTKATAVSGMIWSMTTVFGSMRNGSYVYAV